MQILSKENPYMEKAPVPAAPVMHSRASASTIAWLIHQKFELGIPLYRQEKEWADIGLKLSRATMSNWLLVVYRDWLVHVVDLLNQPPVSPPYFTFCEVVIVIYHIYEMLIYYFMFYEIFFLYL